MRKSIILSPEQQLARDEHIIQILAEYDAKIDQEYQDYMANPLYAKPAKWLARYAKKTFKFYGLKGWRLDFSYYRSNINGNCYLKTKTIAINFEILPILTKDGNTYRLSGLFLHEVAHALCAEEHDNKTGIGYVREPHGKAFRKMCRRIGVPKEFWTATTVIDI